MKNLTKIVAVFVAVLLMGQDASFAASTSTPPVTVSANVTQVLTLTMAIKEEISGTIQPALLTAMNFGNLDRPTNPDGSSGALAGSKVFHVWLGANTSGIQYQITSTMNTPVTSGGTQLPNALGVFPGAAPATGTALTAQSAVGTNKVIFTSNAAGNAATAELVYGISGGTAVGTPFPGWVAIGPDQPFGTYNTTVTYTLTTV